MVAGIAWLGFRKGYRNCGQNKIAVNDQRFVGIWTTRDSEVDRD
jgi:hypothetical protein